MKNEVLTQTGENVSSLNFSEKYLIFYLDDQLFAFRGEEVFEIIGMQKYTVIPNLPHYIKGVVNIRGKIIPLIDLKAKLGRPVTEYSDRTCIVLVEIADLSAGFIVDMVKDVSDISENEMDRMSKPDGANPQSHIQCFCKLENDVILLLNTENILAESSF